MPAHDERETIRVTGGVGCTAGGSVSDLVQRLTAAETAAIENERPALEHPVGRVVGLTVELTIDGAGQVREAVCYVERRTSAGALLSRYAGRGSAA